MIAECMARPVGDGQQRPGGWVCGSASYDSGNLGGVYDPALCRSACSQTAASTRRQIASTSASQRRNLHAAEYISYRFATLPNSRGLRVKTMGRFALMSNTYMSGLLAGHTEFLPALCNLATDDATLDMVID